MAFLLLVASLLSTPAAFAQKSYAYRVSGLYGLGGSLDSDVDSGFSNQTFQLGFSYETDNNTLVGFRYAQLDFDDGLHDDGLGSAELQYLTVAGEYRFNEGYYESGVYLGLGAYELETVGPAGLVVDDSAIGVAVGVTGEFDLSGGWAFLAELSFHWVDLDAVDTLALGHVGIVYRW